MDGFATELSWLFVPGVVNSILVVLTTQPVCEYEAEKKRIYQAALMCREREDREGMN